MNAKAIQHTQGVPQFGRFDYSRAELVADGLIHAVGIVAAISAGSVLLALSVFRTGPWEYVAAVFYVVSLLASLSISCAYNLWPASPAKWLLRRFDHAAIFLLIAATYTPFLAQLDTATARWMTALVWGAAALGIAVKLAFPGRLDRVAIVFYLAVGWSGVMAARTLSEALPASTLWLIVAVRVLRAFSAAGRLNLTLYVGQSLLFVPIYYGFGLGLFDDLAGIHADHPVGDSPGKGHFVRPADHGHAVPGKARHRVEYF